MSDLNNAELWSIAFRDEKNNVVMIQGSVVHDLKKVGVLNIRGANNKIMVSGESNILNFLFKIHGNDNIVEIGRKTVLSGKVDIKGNSHKIKIGDFTTFQNVGLFAKEGCNITIGRDCMFSARIELRTSDSHTVFDLDSKKRVNKPASIVIGDHVWIGKEVIVNKGVTIANNTIVGAKSFVSKSLLDENCVYAGLPAKKVKSRVGWTRELLPWEED